MLLISEYKIGMFAELTKSFSDEDIYLFAKLSGDINPVHLDENYAEKQFLEHV